MHLAVTATNHATDVDMDNPMELTQQAFGALPDAALESIHAKVENEIIRRKQRQLARIKGELRTLSQRHKVPLEPLLAEVVRRAAETAGDAAAHTELIDLNARGQSGQCYVNPDNPLQEWRGRGRKPKWLNRLLAKGVPLESLRKAS